jgi:GNAT superfamily N-acetyltransferase
LVDKDRDMDIDKLYIRIATADDAAVLAKLGARTFYDAFSKDNSAEDMNAYLSKAFGPEIQTAELAEPGSVFLIAELAGEPVGYARLNESQAPESVRAARPIELVRIYALQKMIGHGVGSQLMRACLQTAQKRGCDAIWLGVWEHNARAIVFYRSWGFTKAGTQTFQLGDDLQTDWVMQRTVSK